MPGSVDQTVVLLSDDDQLAELREVEGGEARGMAVEDAMPAQEARGHDQEVDTSEKQAADVKQHELQGGKADDAELKDHVPAQSASDNAENKLHNQLVQEEMNAEQEEEEEEEEDPEEVIFEDPAGQGEATAEVKGEEEDHAREEEDPEEVVFEDSMGEGKVKGEEDRSRAEEDERTVMSDMAKNRQLKKELEIFVGGLDRGVVEGEIRKVFGQVGDVVEVHLHKDFSTNRNKGFAFVKFASKEQVTRALAEMKNPMVIMSQIS
jgi:hypothetical protein